MNTHFGIELRALPPERHCDVVVRASVRERSRVRGKGHELVVRMKLDDERGSVGVQRSMSGYGGN